MKTSQQHNSITENQNLPLSHFFRRGEPWVWFTGGALAVAMIMIIGLLILILINGIGFFWPSRLVEATLKDGDETRQILGLKMDTHVKRVSIPLEGDDFKVELVDETQFRVGNRDVLGADFVWFEDRNLSNFKYPKDAIGLERTEYGNFYGFISEYKIDGKVVATGENAWKNLMQDLPLVAQKRKLMNSIQKNQMGDIARVTKDAQIKLTVLERVKNPSSAQVMEMEKLRQFIEGENTKFAKLQQEVAEIRDKADDYVGVFRTADGREKEIPLLNIIKAWQPNNMNIFQKSVFYIKGVLAFILDEPREANQEGGIFPAIFGTVMMTLIMSLAVTPFGVLAAFYLREYATQGPFVRAVRIAINNLAGVPSIVFGVFGLGFFIYFVGGGIDQFFYSDYLPSPTFGTGGILWASLTLALLTVPVVIVATEESIASVPRGVREGSLALGASKFQTIVRVVLPASVPGILTGIILAMARGAGEVAPLMITGVVKLAPELPFDMVAPFFHLDRKFMHLGFHIYDVGFQSPNVEASKPMVYTTTLLLIGIIVALNIVAIRLRDRIRKKYQTGAFA